MHHNKRLIQVYQAMVEGPTFIDFEGQPFTPIEARRQYLQWLTQVYPNGKWSKSVEPGVTMLRANPDIHIVDVEKE